MALALKLALAPVLAAQGAYTRARTPRLPEPAGPRDGTVGEGARLRLLVAGDSSAAGVGVDHQHDALAEPLARRLAAQAKLQVQWRLLARTGLTTAGTLELLSTSGVQADVAVVVTGVNDVTERLSPQRALQARQALADWLRHAAGVRHVVFAPLPPVHAFPALPQPLRWVAGDEARRHNEALHRWVATRDDVSCAATAPPLDPAWMARDGFHPGAPAYRHIAQALADHLAAQPWRAPVPVAKEPA